MYYLFIPFITLLAMPVAAAAPLTTIEQKLESFNTTLPQDCRSPLIHDAEQELNKQLDVMPSEDVYKALLKVAEGYREANCLVNAKRVYQGLLNSPIHYHAQLAINELEQ